jgi:hypothetical protein
MSRQSVYASILEGHLIKSSLTKPSPLLQQSNICYYTNPQTNEYPLTLSLL